MWTEALPDIIFVRAQKLPDISPKVRESGFRNLGNFCLRNPESWVFGIQNTAQGIRNPTIDWNPESKFHWQRLESSYLESGIHGVESRIPQSTGIQNPSSFDKYWNPVTWNLEFAAWNPESKTALDSLSWGRTSSEHKLSKPTWPTQRHLKTLHQNWFEHTLRFKFITVLCYQAPLYTFLP